MTQVSETSQNFKEKEDTMNPYGLKQINIEPGEKNGERRPKIELLLSRGADVLPLLEAIINTAYPDEAVEGKVEEQNRHS